MEDGEKSSKYFCNLEKRSCEKKCIYKIKDESGVTISDQSDIVKEIHKYYHKLYSVENTVDNSHDINEDFLKSINIPKLSGESKQFLDQPISKRELYDALISMKHVIVDYLNDETSL